MLGTLLSFVAVDMIIVDTRAKDSLTDTAGLTYDGVLPYCERLYAACK